MGCVEFVPRALFRVGHQRSTRVMRTTQMAQLTNLRNVAVMLGSIFSISRRLLGIWVVDLLRSTGMQKPAAFSRTFEASLFKMDAAPLLTAQESEAV